MSELRKYPRTRHILDSRLQPGDEDIDAAAFAEIAGRHLVVEEKVDGANAAISFAPDGSLLLQSRGHYLTGGGRERHFDLFKRWAHGISDATRRVLQERYIVYGEWLYAKHTIFYDALPHYFLEFDALDRRDGTFLSTQARRRLLGGLPFHSVPVLHEGAIASAASLKALVARSAFKSPGWRARLLESARLPEHNPLLIERQTDGSDLMEGLYIKVEENDRVVERYKFVRADFLATVLESDSHWHTRPILPNQLAPGAALA
jgi:hypothetical protein